ncbi:MAG TPA: aminotransferase class I/II-fold pyridoxal phosphate-dependent enzyme [Acidobacteriota bacterium]|nr:aminotransferase class I/II-fold pyridoxal phosphate-dependent enzyme [Acidobacteriota bacterium]
MAQTVEQLNSLLEREAPLLFQCLSPLGRAAFFPPDIPVQAEQARGKAFNATIGQVTNGHGEILALPSIAAALQGLERQERNRAMLYSPPPGRPEVRQAWRDWQRRQVDDDVASSLPLVTLGLTHGLNLVGELFVSEGTPIAVPAPFWGNYRQTFAMRRGGVVLSAPFYRRGRYNTEAIAECLENAEDGRPALAVLNLPSNPGGYSPTQEERQAVRRSLLRLADERPLIVVCDDAYAGLVFQDDIPRRSLFWELVGAHDNLIPIKLDGATKEFSFFGGRVGFLTFGLSPDSPAFQALESKVKSLVRSGVGSPSATTQLLLLKGLQHPDVELEVEAVRRCLQERHDVLHQALREADPEIIRPLPFNSGCFALLQLPSQCSLDSNQVRLHLLEHEDTGLVSIAPNYLRIAFCSVDAPSLPEVVQRIEKGLREMSSALG